MPTTRSKPPTNEVFQAEDELIPHELMPVRGPWGSRLFATVRAVAQAGGLLLMLIVVMSVVSIVGRKLYSKPVPGDIELLQMGTAVAAAAMLAYCEMLGKHLKVDFFTEKLRTRPRAILDGFAHLLLALVSALVAWRTGIAAISNYYSEETSMVLGWPMWPSIALVVPGLALLTLAGLYNAAEKFRLAAENGDRGSTV